MLLLLFQGLLAKCFCLRTLGAVCFEESSCWKAQKKVSKYPSKTCCEGALILTFYQFSFSLSLSLDLSLNLSISKTHIQEHYFSLFYLAFCFYLLSSKAFLLYIGLSISNSSTCLFLGHRTAYPKPEFTYIYPLTSSTNNKLTLLSVSCSAIRLCNLIEIQIWWHDAWIHHFTWSWIHQHLPLHLC